MSKTRREHKPKSLLRAIEKMRLKHGEHRASDGKRLRKGQPLQNSFATMYLD
jgi:hypothetical protein